MKNPPSQTDALRSDIDATRHRMDDTMEAIGDRLQGRHLVDEVLGFFRGSGEPGDGENRTAKIKQTAEKAMHSVTETVKANPVPALLIGAGIAWMIYSNRKHRSHPRHQGDEGTTYSHEWAGADYQRGGAGVSDEYIDRPLRSSEENGTAPAAGGVGSRLSDAKHRIADAGHRLSEKASAVGEQAREKLGHVRERAHQLQQRAGETYQRTRERVVHDAQEHPIEMGLACLAAGLVAGLAMPTSDRMNRLAGPPMDRIRDRTREAGRGLIEKGRQAAKEIIHRGGDNIDRRIPADAAMSANQGDPSGSNAQAQGSNLGDAGMAEQSGPEQNESKIATNRPSPLGQDAGTGHAHD